MPLILTNIFRPRDAHEELPIKKISSNFLLYIYQCRVVYLEPHQVSKMELFTKNVNGFEPLTIFAKKIHFRCLLRNASVVPQVMLQRSVIDP